MSILAGKASDAARTNGQEGRGTLSGQWHSWYWWLLPLLAVAAYATVLRIGFLSDDLVLLYQAQQSGIDPKIFVPQPHWYLYRPLGTLLVWQAGWQVWGYNPLPFHIQSLLLHSGVSLVLGLLVAQITKYRSLGWLSGALFAVFPLHLEAVGWVAAQWDTLAVFFGISSLWLWVSWWRRDRNVWWLYALSVLLYGLAIFTKESLLTFFPLFALCIWLADPPHNRAAWRTLGLALLPYLGVLIFNAGLRLVFWGHLGGYGRTRFDFSELLPVVWDQFINYGRLLLAPINPSLWGQTATQVVGLISTLLLLTGLIWYGRQHWRVLLVAGVWIIAALLPVLFLPIGATDLQNNRFLYLAAGGYCVVVATLTHSLVASAHRWRKHISILVGTLLFASMIVCWVQLRPWYTATLQANNLDEDLAQLLPLSLDSNSTTWYVENTPDNYKGAYVFRLGLGTTRHFIGGPRLNVENVADVRQAPLDEGTEDKFALRFGYNEQASRFLVDYGIGITAANHELTTQRSSTQLFWDFRDCEAGTLKEWKAENAQLLCRKGDGLLVNPTAGDAQVINDTSPINLFETRSLYARLRVLMRSEQQESVDKASMQWFWGGSTRDFSEENSRLIPLRLDGKPHIYWAFVPASQMGNVITGLRLDPVSSNVHMVIQAILVDAAGPYTPGLRQGLFSFVRPGLALVLL